MRQEVARDEPGDGREESGLEAFLCLLRSVQTTRSQ